MQDVSFKSALSVCKHKTIVRGATKLSNVKRNVI